MIINGVYLYALKPILNMLRTKEKAEGVSHGLSEVGYDIRLKQKVEYFPPNPERVLDSIESNLADIEYLSYTFRVERIAEAIHGYTIVYHEDGTKIKTLGRTVLASSIEEFNIPTDLWGELRNKSTHARRFFDCSLGTDMEPGWRGFLTIEIVFHGLEPVTLEPGTGIAKAVFHELKEPSVYAGKYQHQRDAPIPAIVEEI